MYGKVALTYASQPVAVSEPNSVALQDSGVVYNLKLTDDIMKGTITPRARLHVFVVYDNAREVSTLLGPDDEDVNQDSNAKHFEWVSVTRGACSKACSGKVLKPIQRYGKLGRSGNKPGKATPEAKHPSFLYLSIDEASTHVGVRRFR